MTIKSLTVTEEAYDALKRLKHGDESFSEVIVRVAHNRIGAAAKFCGILSRTDAAKLRANIKKCRVELEREFAQRAEKLSKRLA